MAGKETNDQAAPREDFSKIGSPGSANDTEEEPPSISAAATGNQQNGTSGTSGARHQRREHTRRRRHDRRAAPYGGVAGVVGRRGRSEDPSLEVGAERRRTGPTTGETQVKM